MSTTLTVGIALAKIILRAKGDGGAAGMMEDAASARESLIGRLKTPKGVEAVGKQLAAELDHFLDVEFKAATASDREAAVSGLTELLEQELADARWLVDAVIDRRRLYAQLFVGGGRDMMDSLGGEASRLFEFLLERSVDRLASLAPTSTGFLPAASAHLLRATDQASDALEVLLRRPVIGGISASDARGYVSEVASLAPRVLTDREAELADIAGFAVGGPVRWFGYEAVPKAGKTGLLATFALNPPCGVEVVPFFLNANDSEARTRAGFLGTVLARLAEIAGREYVPFPTNPRQERVMLHTMLTEAAAACSARTPPAQLLLMVDALDEDGYYSDPTRRSGSISALLPPRPPSGVRILITRRTNPPVPHDLPVNPQEGAHPLLDTTIWHELPASPDAPPTRRPHSHTATCPS